MSERYRGDNDGYVFADDRPFLKLLAAPDGRLISNDADIGMWTRFAAAALNAAERSDAETQLGMDAIAWIMDLQANDWVVSDEETAESIVAEYAALQTEE